MTLTKERHLSGGLLGQVEKLRCCKSQGPGGNVERFRKSQSI